MGARAGGRTSRRAGSDGHRTLADQFRSWPDERLARLLRERPDLATPAPHDSAHLASRTATRSSLSRALDRLNRLELSVLDALVVAGQTTPEQLIALVAAEPAAIRAAAAAGGPRGGLGGARRAAAAHRGRGVPHRWPGVSGVRPLTEGSSADDGDRRLAALSPAARALLDHVDAQGGTGATGAARPTPPRRRRRRPPRSCSRPGCWCRAATGSCRCPARWALALRGGRHHAGAGRRRARAGDHASAAALVDRTASGAAFEAVRRVELLLDQWGTAPPAALRSGGLGVRDLKAAAALLHVDETTTALLVEVAAAAGLLAQGLAPDGEGVWLPTDAFDVWSTGAMADRWARAGGRLAGLAAAARPGRHP